MDLHIGCDTFLALVAVVWADGEMAPEEAAGILAAASQVQLTSSERHQLEQAIAAPISLDQVETLAMNRVTRLFTYAVASWVVQLKGHVDPREEAALKLLGDRLGLSNIAREQAHAAALNLGTGPTSQAFDLQRLRSHLASALGQIGLD